MKILFICRFLPYPQARTSGRLDQYHYMESLSQSHQISLIAFTEADEHAAADSMKAICEKVIEVPYSEHTLSSRLWRLGWRILLPKVYGRVFSLRYRSRLKQLLSQNSFDVVIVDGMMSQYGLQVTNAKRILDEIDVYSDVAHNLYQLENRLLPRYYAGYDWLRTRVIEMRWADKYDGIFVRSQNDLEVMRKFLPDQNIALLPPWFEGLEELQSIPITRPAGNVLLFSGAMNIPPNIQAAVYFARQVFPILRRRLPDVEFYIVGNSPSPQVKALSHIEGVTVTGEVESLRPYYEMSAVNVVPLFTGGGIIVKTLNGMASGRPTVATPLGNSGTGAKPGRDLLVLDDDPQQFLDVIYRLLVDKSEWQKYAQAGRQFVNTHYDWQKTMANLTDFLDYVTQ
ncbi:MAG: glycosyltransferase [Candidatus Promineifilaceae bacterium]|jgi:glycosyltransferase involved in cell wall biosynthesis